METIKTKNGLRFRDCIYINGKKANSPVFSRKTDCEIWKKRRSSELSRSKALGIPIEQVKKIQFSTFFIDWIISKQAQGISRSTLENYESRARTHLIPHFGSLNLSQITQDKAENLARDLMGTLKPKGVNDVLMLLKQVMRDAQRKKIIYINPLEFLKNVPLKRLPTPYWSEDEINKFLTHASRHPLYDVFLVALNTGLRRGELAGLCWDRVDWLSGQLIISRTRDSYGLHQTTKTKLVRYVPMGEIVRATLERLRNSSSNSPFVFTEHGQPFDVHHLYRVFRKLQVRAGITTLIRFHDLRHTFASQFMMKGGKPFDLQKILGHTNFQMTERYAHLSHDHLKDAMKVVSFGNLELRQISHINPKTEFGDVSESLKVLEMKA